MECCIPLLLLAITWPASETPGDTIEISEGGSALVHITVTRAEVRSGPGEDYYPTSYLNRGETIEAFHRTDSGWLGVRPPEGSFSWIPASDAYLLPGGRVIEITNEKAVSWIGTELGSAKQYRWQVQLKQGEQLTVLGESTRQSADGQEILWYKVGPPSGEFRWIHERAVSDQPQQPVTPANKAESPAAKREEDSEEEASIDGQETTAAEEVSILESNSNGDEVAKQPTTEPSASNSDVVPAQYEVEVFEDGMGMSGMPIGSSVMVEESPAMQSSPNQVAGWEAFGGWHAFDLSDDGLRFTLMERFMGQPVHDPLEQDPFSLEMANQPVRHPRRTLPPDYYTSRRSAAPPETRSHRWRDPRTLGSNRIGGHPSPASDFEYGLADHRQAESPSSYDHSGDNLLTNITKRFVGSDQLPARRKLRDSFSDRMADRRARDFESEFDSDLDGLLDIDEGYRSDPPNGMSADTYRSEPDTAGEREKDPPINWYGIDNRSATTPSQAASTQLANASIHSQTEIEQLKLQLSEIVAQPPNTWNLDPLLSRTKSLIEHGTTPIERGQARLLHDRILEFQQHNRRSALIPGAMTQARFSANGNHQVSTASYAANPVASTVNSSELAGKQPFDATGWLVPVHATTPGQPTHALTDTNGAVVAYVTALPGMNLNAYLNQAVGIVGLRGYLAQLQAGHIQAERVARLR